MYSKIDPNFKTRWVEALRSGKYKQGSNCLRNNNDEFCCLGVAVDVDHPEWWKLTDSYFYRLVVNDQPLGVGFWPSSMEREVGITEEQIQTLVQMNDTFITGSNGKKEHKYDFGKIAKWIDKNL